MIGEEPKIKSENCDLKARKNFSLEDLKNQSMMLMNLKILFLENFLELFWIVKKNMFL